MSENSSTSIVDKISGLFINILISVLCIFAAFAILDAFWLGWFASSWYKTEMAGMLRTDFIAWPWLIFYFMYGIVTFILTVIPNREKPWFYAFIDGALLGLASYGAYNLTNYSIIEGFTLKIMLIDWAWGTCLTAISAFAGWFGFQIRK